MLLEFPGRAEQLRAVLSRFASIFDQLGLVVKSVDMGRGPTHGKKDDVFGFGGEVRVLLSKGGCGGRGLLCDHGRQGN